MDVDVPVLLLVYARPNTTQLVFEQIRVARPQKLYIAADGPKPDTTDKCTAVKNLVTKIDWACEVKTLFRKQNLGSKNAVIEALTWFFDQEEYGIILEDDCLPNQSFFPFCRAMLDRYKDDQRVMHISGTNLQFGRKRGDASYYFSNIPSVWGWAGWKRTWELYDADMKLFPKFKESGMIKNILPDETVAKGIMHVLQMNYENKISSWDHQYGFAIAINNGLCITPNVNLISNIGFSRNDDPFEKNNYYLSNIASLEMIFPMIHPLFFIANKEADLLHVSWDVYDTKQVGEKRLQEKAPMRHR